MDIFFVVVGLFTIGMLAAIYSDPVTQQLVGLPPLPNLLWLAAGILLVIVVLYVLYKVVTSEAAVVIGIIIVGVLVVAGATAWVTYDQKGNSRLIEVVQPTGDDIAADQDYADINRTNVGSNAISMVSVIGYIAVLLLAFVVLTGIGVVLYYVNRNKTGGV